MSNRLEHVGREVYYDAGLFISGYDFEARCLTIALRLKLNERGNLLIDPRNIHVEIYRDEDQQYVVSIRGTGGVTEAKKIYEILLEFFPSGKVPEGQVRQKFYPTTEELEAVRAKVDALFPGTKVDGIPLVESQVRTGTFLAS